MAELGDRMRVYLDNVIASALVRGDLAEPAEMEALRSLQAQLRVGKLEIVTSRQSWREQERTKRPETREELRNARFGVDIVSHDHRVLGFNTIDYGHRGFIHAAGADGRPRELARMAARRSSAAPVGRRIK